MSDCRNARVRLRRRLQDKYLINRVSVQSKKIVLKNDIGKNLNEVKNIPKIVVNINLNNRKSEFLKEDYLNGISKDSVLTLRVEYFENSCSNYKISFLVNNIDIGLENVKEYGITEVMNNVIPELERIYQEVEVE